ncbi:hypothetical protein GCM10010342_24150 [Streptomyces anulatus]|nr:hypothetical protein GCM10010342_24150 [Streptomyces anulatus]
MRYRIMIRTHGAAVRVAELTVGPPTTHSEDARSVPVTGRQSTTVVRPLRRLLPALIQNRRVGLYYTGADS